MSVFFRVYLGASSPPDWCRSPYRFFGCDRRCCLTAHWPWTRHSESGKTNDIVSLAQSDHPKSRRRKQPYLGSHLGSVRLFLLKKPSEDPCSLLQDIKKKRFENVTEGFSESKLNRLRVPSFCRGFRPVTLKRQHTFKTHTSLYTMTMWRDFSRFDTCSPVKNTVN